MAEISPKEYFENLKIQSINDLKEKRDALNDDMEEAKGNQLCMYYDDFDNTIHHLDRTIGILEDMEYDEGEDKTQEIRKNVDEAMDFFRSFVPLCMDHRGVLKSMAGIPEDESSSKSHHSSDEEKTESPPPSLNIENQDDVIIHSVPPPVLLPPNNQNLNQENPVPMIKYILFSSLTLKIISSTVIIAIIVCISVIIYIFIKKNKKK